MKLSNWLFPLLISIALVWFLLSRINIAEIPLTIRVLGPAILILIFFLYICIYASRAFRFYTLLEEKIRLKDLFSIICVHNLANNVLPARTGELSYVYLIKKSGSTTGEGIASLLIARVLDIVTILLLFLISSVFVMKASTMFRVLVPIVSLSIFLIITSLIGIILFRGRVLKSFNDLASATRIERFKTIQYLLRKLEETSSSFEQMTPKNVTISGMVTLMVWGLTYSSLFLLVREIGISLTFFELIFAFSFMTLANILPIRSFAGFGIVEGVWAFTLINFGIPENTAIATGFSIHLILLGYQVLFGLFGMSRFYSIFSLSKKS